MTTGGCSGTQYFRCKADMAKTEDFGCACDVALRGAARASASPLFTQARVRRGG